MAGFPSRSSRVAVTLAVLVTLGALVTLAVHVARTPLAAVFARAARSGITTSTRELGRSHAVRAIEVVHARAGGELAGARSKSEMLRLTPDLVAYRGSDDAPPVVYLHGIHGRPENGCPWMRATAGWLLCPRADVVAPNGTASWSGARTAEVLGRATTQVQARASATVLVGFSQGAYELDGLLRRRAVRARGVVLLAADVRPDIALLKEAGVQRVALGAGEADASFGVLRAAVAQLAHEAAREGIEVRLVSLGAVGHVYVGEDPSTLRDAIRWAAGG